MMHVTVGDVDVYTRNDSVDRGRNRFARITVELFTNAELVPALFDALDDEPFLALLGEVKEDEEDGE